MTSNQENFGVDLRSVLIDIATPDPLQSPPGPNDWDNIGPEDYGPEHDFEVSDEGSIFIFTPISNAAFQWCYKHLPEDCPRWGVGFAIEHRFIDAIVEGAKRDNLMSEWDYEQAMNEMNEQRLQRETHSGCML